MKRSRLLWLLAPVALLVLVLALLPLFLDKDKLLELAQATVREQTGATLSVDGPVALSLLPRAAVSLEDVRLVTPGDEEHALSLRSLQLGLRLLPLLRGQLQVDALSISGLDVVLPAGTQQPGEDTSGMSDAQLDEFYARRRAELAEAGAGAEAGAALALPLALNVRLLDVTDSSVAMAGRDGEAATVIDIRRLTARDLNLAGRPVTLQATLQVRADKPLALDIEGQLRIDQQRQIVALDGVELSADGLTARPLQVKAQGEVNLERRLAQLQIKLALGDTQGEGSLRYAGFESPLIDSSLHLNLFDPALLALAGPEAAASGGDSPAAAGDDRPLPLHALRKIDTRARLEIDRAQFGAHAIDQLQLTVRAREGVVEVKSLSGELHGGKLALTGSFNGRHNTATATTEGSLTGVDIASALAAAAVPPLASGRATLQWQLNTRGQSVNQLLAALNGPVHLATDQVVLNDVSVEHLLCQAVALTNRESLTASFPENTRFSRLDADIQLADGSARLAPLRAELPQLAITGTGTYQLLDRDFKATLKARLSPELETLDPACRVSKRLTAIDWPMNCAGNAGSSPGSWCKVDTEEIISELGRNEAERKIKKKAGKLLDKLFNNKD